MAYILDWPKSSLRFSYTRLWKSLSEYFGQSKNIAVHSNSVNKFLSGSCYVPDTYG